MGKSEQRADGKTPKSTKTFGGKAAATSAPRMT
jgi:hypothetical protein